MLLDLFAGADRIQHWHQRGKQGLADVVPGKDVPLKYGGGDAMRGQNRRDSGSGRTPANYKYIR
ncbi:hypothetical protein GCM10010836_01000 [Aminobacter aminovorans]